MEPTTESSGRVIAGIDGSEHSARILKTAARIAGALKLRLDVICCWKEPGIYLAAEIPGGGFQEADILESEARRLVERTLSRAFGPERPTRMSVELRRGNPAKILVEESLNARMLVLGRRGGGGFLGLRIGSVAAACAAHAHCPVLVVNDDA
ncbi:universal stress protein [Paeniglutamicibacter kerguelensis]|uniref:Nucleotide-binding universal stress UspA family protein n=1 Tax=Paeniglutamicibacter kerguelensis TaxID=254788 RepID=A0ABS4XCS7_9MICC|nr:universal stress protein [Paeniglutamicibacter kerguelensis]MBP2386265.1 nucleotide-binding universal stress UspA family protein [Paeniglutamicibacter kerguelensis]